MRAEDADPILTISKETPARLHLWADRAKLAPRIRSPAGWVRDRALDARYLSCRVTRDWLEVCSRPKHGGDKGASPPVRLGDGVLLKHGELENLWSVGSRGAWIP